MAMTAAEQELAQLEQRYWQAIKEKDLPALVRLTDDPCMVTGAQGHGTVDRKAYEQMLTNAKWSVLDFTLSDVQVRIAQNDVAFVAYRVREELDVSGERVTLDAADASVWIRRQGEWVCALHTESVIGDPYGRDRIKPSA